MDEKLGQHYSGEKGETYSQWQVMATKALGKLVAPKFANFIPPEATVLDFGCGSGANISEIACAERIGVEPNPASFEHLAPKGITGHRSLSSVADASVDVVMSHHALEHCLAPLNELREMRRVLKPDGKLILILPIDDWRNQRRFDPNDINHHLYTWTPLLIGNLVQEAGFRLEDARVLNYQWPPRSRFLSMHLPRPVFNALCWVWSALFNMREMRVVAVST